MFWYSRFEEIYNIQIRWNFDRLHDNKNGSKFPTQKAERKKYVKALQTETTQYKNFVEKKF